MKKLYLFISAIVVSGIILTMNLLVFSNTIVADTTTPQPLSTIPVTTTALNETVYYYEDYIDLVKQIYDDIYDDVYNDVYQYVIEDLDQDLYDQIYAQVLANINEMLSQEQIELYVDDFQQDIYSVIDVAEKSVFGITTYLPNDQVSIGSGVVYKYDLAHQLYYIVTNHHVVEEGTDFKIYLPDESTVTATLVGVDEEVDLAVLTFSSVGLSNIAVSLFGDSDAQHVSEIVLAVGNPIGYNFFNSVTMGILSGLNREVDANRYIKYLQHDSAINSGNSGGPLFNLAGEVIGINVSKYSDIEIEGMGFAIPVNLVKEVIARIEADDIPNNTIMPRIGATFYSVSHVISGPNVILPTINIDGTSHDSLTVTLPNGVTEGLIIKSIESQRALEGILNGGDLVVRINDFNITDLESLQDYLYANFYAGDSITIYYYHFNVTLNTYNLTQSQVTVILN